MIVIQLRKLQAALNGLLDGGLTYKEGKSQVLDTLDAVFQLNDEEWKTLRQELRKEKH